MVFWFLKINLDVKKIWDTEIHVNLGVVFRILNHWVVNKEILFFRYLTIVAVDRHIDVVPCAQWYSCKCFDWHINSCKTKVVADIICKGPRSFKIFNNREELSHLRFVTDMLNHPNQLNPYSIVFQLLSFQQIYDDFPLYIFTWLLNCMRE